ncbi:MAG TPA: DUF2269 family protein [Candidatus Acidoferrales bacterium]|nr:DUF2269 family protein [Candidatus Acidoferrales bacterium]
MIYLIWKLVHVLAAIVFLGNIIVGAFWKQYADRTRDPKIIAHTIAGIIRADRIFTIPAIVVLLIGGFGAAAAGHLSVLGTGWILWGLALFVISGICFGPISRAQRALHALAQAGTQSGNMDWTSYERVSGTWNVFGIIATLAPIFAAAIMILKPALPAI